MHFKIIILYYLITHQVLLGTVRVNNSWNTCSDIDTCWKHMCNNLNQNYNAQSNIQQLGWYKPYKNCTSTTTTNRLLESLLNNQILITSLHVQRTNIHPKTKLEVVDFHGNIIDTAMCSSKTSCTDWLCYLSSNQNVDQIKVTVIEGLVPC